MLQHSVDKRDFEAAVQLRKEFESKPRSDGIVFPDGDCWVCEGYERHGAWITASYHVDDMDGWRLFRPLREEPDLFLRFSRVWQDKDFPRGAHAFANRFGLPRGTGSRRTTDQPTRLSLREFFEESQRAWVALSLYETVLNKDEAGAKEVLAEYRHLDEAFDTSHRYTQQSRRPDTVPLTPLQGALAASVSVINDAVTRLCRQQTSVQFDSPTPDPSAVKVTWHFENLLGAMYLQMWWVVTSNGDLSRCKQCGRLISLTRPHPAGRKRRQDKQFCDDACRQAYHRAKKGQDKSRSKRGSSMGSKETREFILVADDCPVEKGTVPDSKRGSKTVPMHTYEVLSEHPYEFTEDELHHEVHVVRRGLQNFDPEKRDLKRNELPKLWGWGIHYNEDRKIALVGCETNEYDRLAWWARERKTAVHALRSSK